MLEVYILLKSGVYIQHICGVYSSEPSARKAADEFQKKEPDYYHTFLIIKTELDKNREEDSYECSS